MQDLGIVTHLHQDKFESNDKWLQKKKNQMTNKRAYTNIPCEVYILGKNVINICYFGRKCTILITTMYTLHE